MSNRRAVVAGHGDFAAGVLSAVVQISGRDDVFVGLTNRDLGAQDVERAMRALVESSGSSVIFTDLPAGSCAMAARRLQRERPELIVVMGANVATLLDFVFADEGGALDAARHAAEKGRQAIVASGGPGGADSAAGGPAAGGPAAGGPAAGGAGRDDLPGGGA
jgi:PTS system N-acetylgalactosamine-specific IIA component